MIAGAILRDLPPMKSLLFLWLVGAGEQARGQGGGGGGGLQEISVSWRHWCQVLSELQGQKAKWTAADV